MKLARLICIMAVLVIRATQVYAVTLTFDDIPQGVSVDPNYRQYGISFDGGFYAANHMGSAWGPPHSGSNVMVWNYPGYGSNWRGMMFKKDQPLNAYSVGGYFSTEYGVVLEMIGYYQSLDNPVASVMIGDSEGTWKNVHVQIDSPVGIGIVEFRPVTTDALQHFCADDINVNFVPEPTSFLVLGVGLVPLLLRRRRGMQ